MKFHDLLKKREYRLLYSSGRQGRPGPKVPSPELIQAISELKQYNPRFGCLRIGQQISKAFGLDIDKDLVRRVLARHYRPMPNALDLERQLDTFLQYYTHVRVHQSLDGNAPGDMRGTHQSLAARLSNYSWISRETNFFGRQLPHELGIRQGHQSTRSPGLFVGLGLFAATR